MIYNKIKKDESDFDINNNHSNKVIHDYVKSCNNAKILSQLDVILSHATIAKKYNYCRPILKNSNILKLVNSRHPVVERLLPITEEFIANDLFFKNQKKHLAIITGPNMAGKSTYLRQVGLIVLLSQIGSFVPADQCILGLVDQLFTRVGASDNLAGGESTFLVEMNEAANILNNATQKSLIILDEIGRGTSTFDGLALAWAITEYLHNNKKIKAKTLFATHYHELISLAEELPDTFNLNIGVEEYNDDIIFLRKIKKGGANKSYGINVAKMAGLPSYVINRANELLFELMDKKNIVKTPNKDKNDQIEMFNKRDTIIDELSKLDIESISPLEAMNTLDNLKKKIDS